MCEFDRSATIPLRGVLALLVVVGHLPLYGVDVGLLSKCNWREPAVGVFLFMSGYGLCRGFQGKANYVSGLIRRTAIKLFIPMLFIVIVKCFLTKGSAMTLARAYSLGETPLCPHSWYVFVLFALTALTVVFSSCLRSFLWASIMAAISLGGVLAVVLGWPHYWWDCLGAFPVGMICAKYDAGLLRLGRRTYPYILAGAFVAVLCIYCYFSHSTIGHVFLLSAVGPAVLLGFSILPIPKSTVILTTLGVISFELYLVHGVVRDALVNHVSCDWRTLAGWVSVPLSVACAWLLHRMSAPTVARLNGGRRRVQ